MLKRALSTVRPLIIGTAMLSLAPAAALAQSGPRATQFTLPNGMEIVVVPDHRAPVVTHMVWYRVGGADEPPGVSGIAHFLEHLMFKSTDKIPNGEFSKIVSRLGGQDNAFTAQDVTAYFQRVSKDRLPKVMEMEADRMVNLKLDEKEVLTERDVILEERRSRVESNPNAILIEQMDAALYLGHPYRIPVIGWEHEMAKLSRTDALTFYKRFYAPNNAILVVTGDVTPEEVRKLATATYGQVPRNPDVMARERPSEPPQRAARRVELKDPRAGRRTWSRYYIAPTYVKAAPGEAEALDLLMKILASGPTSRIYKKLVVEEKVVSSAGGWYSGSSRDSGKIGLSAVPNDGVEFDKIESLIDGEIAEIAKNGVTDAELDRAKKAYLAEYVYQTDNQASLARRYGWALTVGSTIKDIEEWPERLAKVTADEVKAAVRHLDVRRSVTGTLLPLAPDGVPGLSPTPATRPGSRS
jgi:zinc protease